MCVVSCKPDPTTDPRQNWGEEGQTIAYTVDRDISATKLHSDADWDALMGRLMDYAQEGRAVSFYNTDRTVATKSSRGGSKESATITTTSRQEMKDWCRKMEAEGKTVTIVYNKSTGVWSGTAYALSPREDVPALDATYYYYGLRDEKIYCEIDTTSVFVYMSELADSVLLKQLMAMGDALRVYGNVIIIENLNVNYSTLQTMLVNSGQLELLSPAIHYREFPYSTIIVSVKQSRLDQFRQLIETRGMTIVDSLASGTYALSIASNFGINTIRESAELYETGMFYNVTPSLIGVVIEK